MPGELLSPEDKVFFHMNFSLFYSYSNGLCRHYEGQYLVEVMSSATLNFTTGEENAYPPVNKAISWSVYII